MTDTTVIGSFLEQVKKIKKDKEDKITLVFRSPSNIKGLHDFIIYICLKKTIDKDDLKVFLDKNQEIKDDGKLKDFVEVFLEYKDEEKGKTIGDLCKFWYKQEKPSLFKNPDFIKNEDKIYADFIASNPNIKGLHDFIECICSKKTIDKDDLKVFLNKHLEIKDDGNLKKFVKVFLKCKDEDIKGKTINDLYKFWYKQEKPSLFKNPNFIKNEDKIYADFIASNPDEFNNMTTFDKLTKMRHYDVPNRLLDVTFDPLLALHFSLGENNDGSNTVFIYPVKEKEVKENKKESKPIKNFDSDTITVLSIMSRLNEQDKKILKRIVYLFNKKICRKSKYSFNDILNSKNQEDSDMVEKKYIELIKKEKKDIDIDKEIEKFFRKHNLNQEKIDKGTECFTIIDLFNFFVSTYVSELDWQLKKEIPSWYSNYLSLYTFTQCYLVKPKMNNPRIIAQSGAFIIYPFKDTEIKDILAINDINDDLIFKIDKTETEKLKTELKLLNIKETKYMPDDLKQYATEIKNNYNKIKKS